MTWLIYDLQDLVKNFSLNLVRYASFRFLTTCVTSVARINLPYVRYELREALSKYVRRLVMASVCYSDPVMSKQYTTNNNKKQKKKKKKKQNKKKKKKKKKTSVRPILIA